MNTVTKMKKMLELLKATKYDLTQVEEALKTAKGYRYESLYEQEFKLSMDISGIYGDMQILSEQFTPETQFEIKRIMKEASTVFCPVVIEIKRSNK